MGSHGHFLAPKTPEFTPKSSVTYLKLLGQNGKIAIMGRKSGKTSPQNPSLTKREQEILKLLLESISLKEIAINLGVSSKTVDFHKGNLYRKLGIQSMHELLVLFANKEIPESVLAAKLNVSLPKEFVPAVYKNWITYNDETSSANFLVKSKGIYIFSGSQGKKHGSNAGAYGFPDIETSKAMKSMSMLSFNVLGDGNDYLVMLPTSETVDGDHYFKKFSTVNGKITTITVSINNDLTQWGYSGILKEFIQDHIMYLQFHTACNGRSFNLMIWDIKLYQT